MRRPSDPGTAIDARRKQKWLGRFGAYRTEVTRGAVEDWLEQFEANDRDVAARLLDVVEFYGVQQIHVSYRQTLEALPGWNRAQAHRKGVWRFAAMSGSAGESGDGMLYQFRIANNLDSNRFNPLFVGRRDLLSEKLGPDDTVVLLDDFSGTGTQVCKAWNDPETAFGELLASVGRVYLVLVAATRQARQKIKSETSLSVFPAHELDDRDNIFSDRCTHFSPADKNCILRYCEIASTTMPRGFGDCGLAIVFQHRTPNNTIPVLHAQSAQWSSLFPRHD